MKAPPDRRAPATGFTLLEVMIALIIFTMAAVVLGSAYLNILNSYAALGRSNEDDADIAYARQQLFTQPTLATAEAGEQFQTVSNKNVSWTADIEQAQTTDLFTVTFTCTIDDGSGNPPKQYVQTFMLLRPTWSDPTVQGELKQTAANRIQQLQMQQASEK